MTLTLCAGIVTLLVLTLISYLIWARRDTFPTGTGRALCLATGALQAAHIVLYLTGLLDMLAQANPYLAFGLCAVLSLLCLLMSAWMLLPASKLKHGVKYLFLSLATLQVLATAVIFLLPEAGLPPAVGIRP